MALLGRLIIFSLFDSYQLIFIECLLCAKCGPGFAGDSEESGDTVSALRRVYNLGRETNKDKA